MTSSLVRSALIAALLALCFAATVLLPAPVSAAGSAPDTITQSSAPTDNSVPEPGASQPDDDDADNGDAQGPHRIRLHHHHAAGQDNDLVSVGHDAEVPAGVERDSVVAVFGSATNHGTAHQDVVSVFGDTTVDGPTSGSAVAVLGNVSINSDVGEDVVAVMGNVHLGPAAHVHGQVVSVMGTVTQDPAAIVDHGIQRVLPESFASADGLRKWFSHGVMMGRPLVIGSGLTWLWGLSFALLALYVILALLFRDATEHCIATVNENPGKSLITAILAVLLTPLMLFLLVITVVGIPVIPIAMVLLFVAGVFGKTAVLGWIGGRCFGARAGQPQPHPALAVLVGGIVVMLIYLIPLVGFVVYILLSMIGYGAVLYTLLNHIQRSRSAGGTPSGPAPVGAGPGISGGAAPEPAATPAPGAAAAAAPATAAATAPAAAPVTGLPLSTLPRAGFWVRMGALLIDAVIVAVVVRVLLSWPDTHSDRIWLLALAVYGAVMWKAKGTTIGGIVFDLRVTRLDSRPLDWPTVCVRALGCILSLCALGLGFIWIAIDAGRQAWHDKLAGTVVVQVPKGTPLV
jgi:uncharacterized RDD family membrane protein YckC